MKNISTRSLKKTVTRENWDKLSVYFSILQLYQWKLLGVRQFDKISVLVNFINQKLKSKNLVCLSFLWRQFLLREREKIFHIFQTINCCRIFEEFRSQKQQASSILFENTFKLLLGNRSFKILITKQLVFRS